MGWNISRFGIAQAYSDPVARIRAQDESIYTDSALEMARRGDWLTPKAMGRVFLRKPPLLMWMSAVGVRLFGWNLLAVRLPALLLGAAAVSAVFVWVAWTRSWPAGALAAGVLLFTPLWEIFSRLNYTDVPATSFALLGLVSVVFDPRLERWWTRTAFGTFTAASILTKSVAGALPFVALVVYWAIVGRDVRPRIMNMGKAILVAAVVFMPWHIYQGITHAQWFWADYVKFSLIGVGLNTPDDTTFNRPFWFYCIRLAQMDPLLMLLGATGVVRGTAVIASTAAKKPGAVLALAWTASVILALCAFRTKNLPYLVLLLPPLVIVAVVYGPSLLDRYPAVTTLGLAAIFIVKASATGAVWSLVPGAPPLEGAHAMRAYYNLDRQAELFSVETDDEFYSSTIPLSRVRYVYVDPAGTILHTVPHYGPLGILLSADQFADSSVLIPQFREHLSSWGLNSVEPVGSLITLRARGDLLDLIRLRAESDFYLPASWLSELGRPPDEAFELWRYSDERVFLLSRKVGLRRGPVTAIPPNW
jgi:hypothetical protein